MRLTTLALATAVVLGSGLVAPRLARACDCADSRPSFTLPADGAEAVPTNTRVVLSADKLGVDRWVGTDPRATPRVVLRALKKDERPGAAVPVLVSTMLVDGWGTMIVVTPKRPLAAATRYEVGLGGPKGAFTRAAGFTTGKGKDTMAPVFAGVAAFTAVVSFRAPVSKCDGAPPFSELTWKHGEASDDSGAGLLRLVYVQKKGQARALRLVQPVADKPVSGVRGAACDPFKVELAAGDEVCVTVEVVDAAGNVAGAAVEKCMVAKKL